ncbi:helix-turn-helix domain-containing protein [Maribellus mangrovi]|uniref:helix-turn-helix domain-containing protein n=1 Tax=Maribellus mangrovi TaxID=3133146 RepID=UPI0030ECB219
MINTYEDIKNHPDAFKQLSVRDLLFVHYHCPQIERFEQLYNHYNQFTFSLKGERILHQGEKSWKVTPQTSYFQRKTAYVQEVTNAEGWEVLVFHIPDEFLIQFANEFIDNLRIGNLPELPTDMFIKIELNEITRTYFYSMLPYFTQKTPPSEKLLELKFKELLLDILSNPSNKQLLAYILHLSDDIKTTIWQVMEKNYTYHLTLKDFARISSRSLAAFKRDFMEYYHTTPGKWLTNKRLEHAGTLLKSTKKSISEIAYDSGFENSSHFSRIFKEKFGLSPLQYRKDQAAIV